VLITGTARERGKKKQQARSIKAVAWQKKLGEALSALTPARGEEVVEALKKLNPEDR